MKKLVVLSILLMVLGCASWAGAYSYSVSGDYGVFTNNSGSDAVVDMVLWYGLNHGHNVGHYNYSVDGGTNWVEINRGGDGQTFTSGVVADQTELWLKFVSGTTTMSVTGSSTQNSPYYFEFNDGNYYNSPAPSGCVAIVEGSPAVPIPAAIWLLGSGLGSLLFARRKRKGYICND